MILRRFVREFSTFGALALVLVLASGLGRASRRRDRQRPSVPVAAD
jgi:hypothetical protein